MEYFPKGRCLTLDDLVRARDVLAKQTGKSVEELLAREFIPPRERHLWRWDQRLRQLVPGCGMRLYARVGSGKAP